MNTSINARTFTQNPQSTSPIGRELNPRRSRIHPLPSRHRRGAESAPTSVQSRYGRAGSGDSDSFVTAHTIQSLRQATTTNPEIQARTTNPEIQTRLRELVPPQSSGGGRQQVRGDKIPQLGNHEKSADITAAEQNPFWRDGDPQHQANLTAPLEETLEQELNHFAATLPAEATTASNDTKVATLVQSIQGRFQGAGYTYGRDEMSEGVSDQWATPNAVIADQGLNIDCEDFAFMAQTYGQQGLTTLGLDGEFVVHGCTVGGEGHAVCVFHASDGNQYVIDGTMYSSGRGNPAQVATLQEYTEQHNITWWTDETEARAYADNEASFIQQSFAWFGEERSALGGLSILDIGAICSGALLIPSNVLKTYREYRAFKRDRKSRKLNNTVSLPNTTLSPVHRKTKLVGAALKTVIDTVRLTATVLIIAGAGLAAAPIVALVALTIRSIVNLTERVERANTKAQRLKRRYNKAERLDNLMAPCPSRAQHILATRIDYKRKLTRFTSSPILTGVHTIGYGFTIVLSVVGIVKIAAASSIMAAAPIVFGVVAGGFALIALIRSVEAVYKGYLNRQHHERLMLEGDSFLSKRVAIIKSSDTHWMRRIGASINIIGWLVDALDDVTDNAPFARMAVRTLLCPIFFLGWLTEGKAFSEEQISLKLKETYVAGDTSNAERNALLEALAIYYNLPPEDVLLRWMNEDEVANVKAAQNRRQHSPGLLAKNYLKRTQEMRRSATSPERKAELIAETMRRKEALKEYRIAF